MPRPDEDHDLCLALRARQTWALERVYDLYGRRAFGLAYRITNDSTAAEEAVQDAFLSIWQHADRINPARGRLLQLLLAIVRNKSIDLLRRQRGQPVLFPEFDLTLLKQPSMEVADVAILGVQREVILGAMKIIPADQRRTIELAYFLGYTHTEIASEMDVPLGTVKSRLRLALDKLRTLLQEEHAT
jgi:RNA polymerase sigma-70 factor (ECF subfamily)